MGNSNNDSGSIFRDPMKLSHCFNNVLKVLKNMTAIDVFKRIILKRKAIFVDVTYNVNARPIIPVKIDKPLTYILATTNIQRQHKTTKNKIKKEDLNNLRKQSLNHENNVYLQHTPPGT